MQPHDVDVRLPFWVDAEWVGSVHPAWLQALARHGVQVPWLLQFEEQQPIGIKADKSDFCLKIASFAVEVHRAGLAGPWRDEAIPVLRPGGEVLACVERALVRVLGLCTQAVHLVGCTTAGRYWVQQRSLQKPNDPGLWDTLMGGTVSGTETLLETLERETWEEAGLRLDRLLDVRQRGCFVARRSTPDGGGYGLLVEQTHWYTATVPDDLVPANQDGEVAQFACWSVDQVRQAIENRQFTPEAAWVLSQIA